MAIQYWIEIGIALSGLLSAVSIYLLSSISNCQ